LSIRPLVSEVAMPMFGAAALDRLDRTFMPFEGADYYSTAKE